MRWLALLLLWPSLALAQPSLDAVTHTGDCNGCSSVTVTVQTSATNEIILVGVAERNTQTSMTIANNTCTGLTWTNFGTVNVGAGNNVFSWWAKAASTINCTVTVTASAACFFQHGCAWGSWAVSGANFTSPIDPNGSLPYSANGTVHLAQSPNCTSPSNTSSSTAQVTTSVANSIGFIVGEGTGAQTTPCSGTETQVLAFGGGGFNMIQVIMQSFTTIQTARVFGMIDGLSARIGNVIDAGSAAPSTSFQRGQPFH